MAEALHEQLMRMARHVRDPQRHAPPPGVEARRLAVYRQLFLGNLESLLAGAFPVARASLGAARWQALVQAFYADPRCHTPLFTELGGEFVDYLETAEAADLPPWLAPEQVRVLPITDAVNDYAEQVVGELRARGLRADIDRRSEKLGYKIRDGETTKVPYLLVVGQREAEDGTVSLRLRHRRDGRRPSHRAVQLLQVHRHVPAPVPARCLRGDRVPVPAPDEHPAP